MYIREKWLLKIIYSYKSLGRLGNEFVNRVHVVLALPIADHPQRLIERVLTHRLIQRVNARKNEY